MTNKLGILLILFLFASQLAVFQLVQNANVSVFAETGTNDDTLREHWARMLWQNLTNAKVNASFPFVKEGTATFTNETREELLSGAVLYLQTGNSSYLDEPEAVCQWLNGETEKKHLWFTYDLNTGWQKDTVYAKDAAYAVERLAVYANISTEWKPLLQEVVNEFIRIYIPSDTHRIVFYVDENDTVGDDTCWAAYQSHAIQALSIASKVLENDTVKNVAYSMIMNYTLGSVNLPYHGINQDGTAKAEYCKEDETFGNYLLAMETFYYYYPDNTTVKDRIKDVAFASQYMWNSGQQRWNYKTNANTGGVVDSIAVHGFGLTDESLFNAYLIWGNTTWRERAKQDFDTMVVDGAIINSGIIDHSTDLPDDGSDGWNVHGRRFANIYYCYSSNQTFLNYGNFLFANATQKHNRTLGWAYRIVCTTGADYSGWENKRLHFQTFLTYLNITAFSINAFTDVFRYFGIPELGNSLLIYAETQSPVYVSDALTGTWYMRSDSHTSNNVSGYKLSETQSTTGTYNSRSKSGGFSIYYAVRVWIVFSDSQLELTDGEPVAIVSRNIDGEGIQSANWTCPGYANIIDAVMVKVYQRFSDETEWNLRATFVTYNQTLIKLPESTWTFHYYTVREEAEDSTLSRFYWGNSTCNSRVQFQYYKPDAWELMMHHLSQGNLIGFITFPYFNLIGNLFYGVLLLVMGATLYRRYESFVPIAIMMVLFGGVGGVVTMLVPAAGLHLAWLFMAFGLAILFFKLVRAAGR